ncbi:hypothetical protein U1Q18_039908 [Sarracenia purpurea var. burkii]
MSNRGIVGVLSNKINKEELKPGDHIYSWSKKVAYLYAHHGIYVGDGEVIHFTTGDRGNFRSSSSHSSGPGSVESCTIDHFLSGGKLNIFQYAVSDAHFRTQVRGTCSTAASDPPEDVLHRAEFLLKNGFGGYHSFRRNREDFAIYCKTGLLGFSAESGQCWQYLNTLWGRIAVWFKLLP